MSPDKDLYGCKELTGFEECEKTAGPNVLRWTRCYMVTRGMATKTVDRPAEQGSRPQRLLIVDDEQTSREFCQTVVEDAGYEVATAANGREALAALDERSCDLIISDVRMPEIDGLSLLSELRKRAEQRAEPPTGAILLTGDADPALAVQGMQLGALDYALKPVEPPALLCLIEGAIERSQQISEAWRENQETRLLVEEQKAELTRMSQRLAALARVAEGRPQTPPERKKEVARRPFLPLQMRRDRRVALETSNGGEVNFHIPAQIHFDEGGSTFSGTLCRVNDGFISLTSPISSEPGTRLQVLYRGRSIPAEVIYCRKENGGCFRLGVSTNGADVPFRSEKRLPVDVQAVVMLAGRSARWRATVVDLSLSGLGLNCQQAIEMGEYVCVELGSGLVFGEVRHCQKRQDMYRIGIRIEECLVGETVDESGLVRFVKKAVEMLGRHTKG